MGGGCLPFPAKAFESFEQSALELTDSEFSAEMVRCSLPVTETEEDNLVSDEGKLTQLCLHSTAPESSVILLGV